jgi:hypothetical protein
MRSLSLLAVSGLQLAAACRPASLQIAGDGGSYVSEISKPVPEAGRVGRGILLATNASTLREALNRARPDFLRPTNLPVRDGEREAATPVVYVDGKPLGAPDVLQLIQVAEVAEVRLLRPAVARMLYGSGCTCSGGVIAVTRLTGR